MLPLLLLELLLQKHLLLELPLQKHLLLLLLLLLALALLQLMQLLLFHNLVLLQCKQLLLLYVLQPTHQAWVQSVSGLPINIRLAGFLQASRTSCRW